MWLCRGGHGGSFGHGEIGNGGLWWPERASERRRAVLAVTVDLLLPSPEMVTGIPGMRDGFF